MQKLTIDQVNYKGKKVLMRADFNIPLDENGIIVDDKRIRDAIPGMNRILNRGGKLILISHLGRPKGRFVPELSLRPIAKQLSRLLDLKVKFAPDCIGEHVKEMIDEMFEGDIILLENLRFHKEEEEGDDEFAKELASFADIYINNAFGVAHRAHASVSTITKYFKEAAAGNLLTTEIDYISETIKSPVKPFAAIIGGNKIAGKIEVISKFMDLADKLFLGGGIANTMLYAKGYEVGNSVFEEDKVEIAKEIFKIAEQKGVKIILPLDVLCGKEFENDTERELFDADKQEKGWITMGIGPKTVELYKKELAECKTVIWNGPMTVFEFSHFAQETFEIAAFIAEKTVKNEMISIIGGGDTAAAIKKAGFENACSHISTGGGASLELMCGRELPGLAALSDIEIPKPRKLLIAGNWKMNKDIDESDRLAAEIKVKSLFSDKINVMVAPNFTALYTVAKQLENTNISVGSQDIHWEDSGAFTGAISGPMIKSSGADFVIIGHSERRQLFCDTDKVINIKLMAAIKNDLTPVLCVGESLEEREKGIEKDVISLQIKSGLANIGKSELSKLVIAYEPVWAIGTGRTATPKQAEEMHRHIRNVLAEQYDFLFAQQVRILYGGSVKVDNAKKLFSQPNIDGGLIGGASLKGADFCKIIEIAEKM